MHIQTIFKALETLDPENDGHWTTDGAPRLDVLAPLLPAVTRAHITQAAPLFNRKNPVLPDLAAEREAAEAAMRDAAEADVQAAEKRKVAQKAAQLVQKHEAEIKDRHTLTRQNQAWLKSQLQADATRAAHQRQVDQAVLNAGGMGQVGMHPVERNIAARNKAARRNIVIPAKKTA
jgi:hypothetical protein